MPASAILGMGITPWLILHDDPVQNRILGATPRDPNSGLVCISIKWMWLPWNRRSYNQLAYKQSLAEFVFSSTIELFPSAPWFLKAKRHDCSPQRQTRCNFLTTEVFVWVKLREEVEWYQLDLSTQQQVITFIMGCWISTTEQAHVSSFLLSWNWPEDQATCKESLLSSVICVKVICNKNCFNVLTLQFIIS